MLNKDLALGQLHIVTDIKGQLHIVTDIKGKLHIVTDIKGQLQIVADIMGRTEVETKCRQDTLQFSTSVELYTQNVG